MKSCSASFVLVVTVWASGSTAAAQIAALPSPQPEPQLGAPTPARGDGQAPTSTSGSGPGASLVQLLGPISATGASRAFVAAEATGRPTVFMGSDFNDYGIMGTFSNHPLGFRTNNTLRMFIDTSGNVGIGTASPSAKLHVTSSSGVGVEGNTTNGWAVVGVSTAGISVFGGSIDGVGVVAASENSNIVEGYTTLAFRKFHITNAGTYVAGSDFAEALPARGDRAGYEPGDVLIVSTDAPGQVEKASRPYDPRVAGIYSTRPGLLGADKDGTSRVDPNEVPVAIVGIVPTKVSATQGPIQVGDLLTTSSTPGHAMRCANRTKCVGAVVGKALEPLTGGTGVIKVLVMLR